MKVVKVYQILKPCWISVNIQQSQNNFGFFVFPPKQLAQPLELRSHCIWPKSFLGGCLNYFRRKMIISFVNQTSGLWRPDPYKEECGVRVGSSNIVGGEITKNGDFPHMALIGQHDLSGVEFQQQQSTGSKSMQFPLHSDRIS